MKAISVGSQTVMVGSLCLPQITLYADSAIGRDVMPLFVPDIDVTWHSHVCLAVRVLRLGKNIAEKFAMRYVDAIGLVNVMSPDPGITAGARLIESGCDTILDSAITTGTWVEGVPEGVIDVAIGSVKTAYTVADLEIARHISRVSRVATIKTGDILILSDTAVEAPMIDRQYITGEINGTRCLNIKVKC